jgi:hypothetical protein
MTTNAQAQFADMNEVNLTWQIPEAETLRIKDDSTIRYAAAAVAFGLVFGVALAAVLGNAALPISSPSQTSVVSTAAVVPGQVAPRAGHALPQHSQTSKQAVSASPSSVLPVALKTSVNHKSSTAHRRHGVRKASFTRISFNPRSLKPSFRMAPAPAPAPFTASLATRQAEQLTAAFFMEGDATVADFDSSSGMIQTDEGKTFIIGMPAGVSSAGPWQDYHRNVHYRCDQSGNCTISGAGVVVSNAKLT